MTNTEDTNIEDTSTEDTTTEATTTEDTSTEATTTAKTEAFYSKRIFIISSLVALMIVPLIIFLVLADDSDEPPGVPIATSAPNIEGITLDGEIFNLESLQGNWVVVNFFATWCAPCEAEHGEFIELRNQQQYPTEVVSIIFNEAESKGRDFFERFGGDWPVLLRDTTSIVLEYRIISVPETYLLAPNGLVAAHWRGPITSEIINNRIQNIVESA